ncbi:helix-turn-helix domain-containing protein [Streptomyces sp. NPDC096079]|uniref:helix-turn-helix domain-containing protein n=1 Tax=Streptomyces sp. NPDC096079 TaxID=3155820 RepID=UPI003331663D
MGRPEKPVNRAVPARAKLADFLRRRKAAAGLTYEQMARLPQTKETPSAATLKRAAAGEKVPSWETVEEFILMTLTKDEEFGGGLTSGLHQGLELWIRARRATRAPYDVHKAPDPTLISSRAGLSRALRRQHIWAGYPTPGEMQRIAGSWSLPTSTARRVIAGDTLPVDPHQTAAFLRACYVLELVELEPWLQAAGRAHEYGAGWARAHQSAVEAIAAARAQASSGNSASGNVVYLKGTGAERAA